MTVTIEGPIAVVISVLVLGGLAGLVTWGYWLQASGADRQASALGRGVSRSSYSSPLVAWMLTTIAVVVLLNVVGRFDMIVSLAVAGVVCGVWVWWLSRQASRRRASESTIDDASDPETAACLTDDQAHEVARLTLAGYEIHGTRPDGSVELVRPASWTHAQSTTRVSPGGHRYGTFGANTYVLVILPIALAGLLGWQTLFLTVPIAVGYAVFRWRQYTEESTIRTPDETRLIEQADTDLHTSGHGHDAGRL